MEQTDDLNQQPGLRPAKRKTTKRQISTPNPRRPPSRHKTPPKALGLDTPTIEPVCNLGLRVRPHTSKNDKGKFAS